MKKSIKLIASIIVLFTVAACSGDENTSPTNPPATSSPSSTPVPTRTPTPSSTPTPSITPTTTPTFTPNPTEIVENYMSMLGEYLTTQHDAEILGMKIESGSLVIRVQSHGSGQSFLRLMSWQIINDLAQLLQFLGPNAEMLSEVIGSEEYAVDLLVLSEDGSLGFRSETGREIFIAIQGDVVSNQQWEILANGHFEEF